MRSALSLFCGALVVVVASTGVRADDDIVVLKVQGQGIDKDGALKDALRHAIEQGGQQEIASKSKTKDFQLEYDVVLSRASGLVKDYKILSENTASGIVTVQVQATVSKKLIDATWADVAILLKQLGRPKIMVIFTEIIHDLDRIESNREVIQLDSVLATQIERKLLKLGFKVVNPGQMKDVDKKKAEAAAAEDNPGALKALAMSYGAQIYFKGTSRASGPQHTQAAGIDLNMWETDATIQAFWTETADSIFSNTMTGVRGGSRVAGPIGGRQALEKTGAKLADASVYDLLESWTRGTAGGVGDVIVEVHNVADIKQRVAIKKALTEVKGVEEVTVEGIKGTVKFTIQTNMTGEQFVDFMAEMKFDGFTLDVEDAKSKTITCKVK